MMTFSLVKSLTKLNMFSLSNTDWDTSKRRHSCFSSSSKLFRKQTFTFAMKKRDGWFAV
jgi:hypothetical protein